MRIVKFSQKSQNSFQNSFQNWSQKFFFFFVQIRSSFSWALKWTRAIHYVKSVQIRSFFWSVFSCIWTEYGDIRGIQSEYAKSGPEKILYLGTFHTVFLCRTNIRFYFDAFQHFVVLTAVWKVSKYFPVLSPNTGKYEPEKIPYLDAFHTVFCHQV